MSDRERIRDRVNSAAEDALERQKFVTLIDVYMGMRWLEPSHVEAWRQERLEYLERWMQPNPAKLRDAACFFRDWAESRGLQPTPIEYLAKSLDPRPLKFTESGDPAREDQYRTQWLSPNLSEKDRKRIEEKQSKPPEVVVIQPLDSDWTCGRCASEDGGDFLVMDAATNGPICLKCAGLGDLVFLPSGDTKLTRRARAESSRSFVVVRFSRARQRYERQGVLVEAAALERARGGQPLSGR